MDDIEITSVHYKTPKFIFEQYESIRKFYPKIKYKIIDGSDNGEKYFIELEKNDSNFFVKRFGFNIHHGPGMDYALKNSDKKFTLVLDSDVTLKKPLIFDMLNKFNGYSVGKKIIVNSSGYKSNQKYNTGDNNFIYEYVHPYCMLISNSEYRKHKPFIKHGAPCIETMMDLKEKGLTSMLTNFSIEEYVDLKTRGTVNLWGYNL